jgi:hypothetical protein
MSSERDPSRRLIDRASPLATAHDGRSTELAPARAPRGDGPLTAPPDLPMGQLNDRERLRWEIEQTRASLAARLEQLDVKVRVARERVKDAVNVRLHYERHPWRFLAVAFGAGFALGWFTA